MSTLEALYKQLVQDHARRPRHYGELGGATHEAAGHNPSCGDRVKVQLRLEGSQIAEVRFTGQGCAVSTASASLMVSALRGRSVPEARALSAAFGELLRTGEARPDLGDLNALGGVHRLHTRVKCAALCWQALDSVLGDLRD